MTNSTGHILRTNPNWFYNLKAFNPQGKVNFFRKSTNKVHKIKKGNNIYFLRKKTKAFPHIAIIGMATFIDYKIHTIQEAWDIFKENNGYPTFESFSSNFDNADSNSNIGCLILENIIFFESDLFLKDCYIEFPKQIQQGRSISLLEENNILSLLNGDETIKISSSSQDIKLGYDILRRVKVRVNQQIFRKALIELYGECVLCGIKNKNILKASHSKSWSESNSSEKTNSKNGLLLCANHDSLYDNHLISFDAQGKILISNTLSSTDKKLLNISPDMKIKVSKEALDFISYHRKIFDKKNRN